MMPKSVSLLGYQFNCFFDVPRPFFDIDRLKIAKYMKMLMFLFSGGGGRGSIGDLTYPLNQNKVSIYQGYNYFIIHVGTNDMHVLSIDQCVSVYCETVISFCGDCFVLFLALQICQKIKEVNMALLNFCLSYHAYKVYFIHPLYALFLCVSF